MRRREARLAGNWGLLKAMLLGCWSMDRPRGRGAYLPLPPPQCLPTCAPSCTRVLRSPHFPNNGASTPYPQLHTPQPPSTSQANLPHHVPTSAVQLISGDVNDAAEQMGIKLAQGFSYTPASCGSSRWTTCGSFHTEADAKKMQDWATQQANNVWMESITGPACSSYWHGRCGWVGWVGWVGEGAARRAR